METETLFDLRISVTDYTGTLEGCILSGAVAENMLNCKVWSILCSFLGTNFEDIYLTLIQFYWIYPGLPVTNCTHILLVSDVK